MKFLVVIPTYNESESIELVLARLQTAIQSLPEHRIEILVVDDNSPDGTAELVEKLGYENLNILHRPGKGGLGPAYLAGFAWGLDKDFDRFVEMDADGSHQPEQFPALCEAAFDSDLVLGTRWIAGGEVVNWPWSRRAISKSGTWYASRVLRLPYRDLTSGYRVISRRALESIALDEVQTRGYGFQVEMAMRIHDAGLQVREVPIRFVERERGISKMSGDIVFEAWKMVTFWGLQRLFGKRN